MFFIYVKVNKDITFRGTKRVLLSELISAVEAFGLEGQLQRRTKQAVRTRRRRTQPDRGRADTKSYLTLKVKYNVKGSDY